jgi:hypothetical protein
MNRKDIDAELIRKLAGIQCTHAEIAQVVGCSESHIDKKYGPQISDWREAGKASLRRKQWEKAMDGNITMLIWLGKQYLDQSDRTINDATFEPIEIIIGPPASQNRISAAGAVPLLDQHEET